MPPFGSDGSDAVTSIVYTDYIVAAPLVFYFMIIRVILLSTHTVNILLPVTTEYVIFFVNQQNDSIMILCGAGDKPISN